MAALECALSSTTGRKKNTLSKVPEFLLACVSSIGHVIRTSWLTVWLTIQVVERTTHFCAVSELLQLASLNILM